MDHGKKQRDPEDVTAFVCWQKALTMWTELWKNEMEYQTANHCLLKICMQIEINELELRMEQQTGSK